MSIEDAKAFVEKLKTDEAFRMEYAKQADKQGFIQNAGYNFSDEEMAQIKNELSDDDLLDIAGGFSCSSQSCSSAQNCGGYCPSNCIADLMAG